MRSGVSNHHVVAPHRGASELTVALLRNDLDLVINAYGGLRQGIEKGSKTQASSGNRHKQKAPGFCPGLDVSEREFRWWDR
jgi:hypothetical protein